VASVSELYLVDSSVLLRAIIEGSPAARKWFEGMDAGSMVASKLLEVECRRVLLNRAILAGGPDVPVDPTRCSARPDAFAQWSRAQTRSTWQPRSSSRRTRSPSPPMTFRCPRRPSPWGWLCSIL